MKVLKVGTENRYLQKADFSVGRYLLSVPSFSPYIRYIPTLIVYFRSLISVGIYLLTFGAYFQSYLSDVTFSGY